MNTILLAEKRWLPDWLIRIGIRKLLARRLEMVSGENSAAAALRFAGELRIQPIAVETDAANAQHYEVPPEFFHSVLGPRLKYSCCHFETPTSNLAEAEVAMLELTCRRAEIQDGQRILDLGCGWGSFGLWAAERFPGSQIVAVSNSAPQRRFILQQAERRNLTNLDVFTADIREFEPAGQFDRVVSIEMFEHMRNFEILLRRIASWMHPAGKLFVHIFCHRTSPYEFTTSGDNDWMAQHFFTGGIMPSFPLLSCFQEDLALANQWDVDGNHYARTCEAWLERLDGKSDQVRQIFLEQLPSEDASLLIQRWRMFFMACAELFRYNGGHEWFVGHYLFKKE